MIWKDALFEEKSLWAVFRKSGGSFSNAANFLIVFLVFLAATMISLVSFPALVASSLESQADSIVLWAEFGATISATILSFLIASFTILATITKPSLLAALAQVPHDQNHPGGVTELKHILFSFINTFVIYVGFLTFCVLLKFSLQQNFPVRVFAAAQMSRSAVGRIVVEVLFSCVYVGYATGAAAILVELKSLIWNVYQAVLLTIAFNDE